jgi:formylglycine-generating enzyme required for sulfatase activity
MMLIMRACYLGLFLIALPLRAAPVHKGDVRINAKDGAAMLWVPAGEFLMGTSEAEVAAMLKGKSAWKAEWFTNEKPQRLVTLDGYWIYKYEVTVAQYKTFCTATKRKMPEQPVWSTEKHPVVNVTWFDAEDYADWAGVRLPTEAEWEKAARGTDGRRYPWGNTWEEERCNNYSDRQDAGGGYQRHRAAPVGSYPTGASPYGVLDLAGNVWEWVADWFASDYYATAPSGNPQGPEKGELRVLRGGSWGSSSATARTTARLADAPDLTYHDDGGFRCAASPSAPALKNK